MKTVTVCYRIPYSTEAIRLLAECVRKCSGTTWSVNENEVVTITCKERHLPKIEKIIAPII
jgi:hypothetical protein